MEQVVIVIIHPMVLNPKAFRPVSIVSLVGFFPEKRYIYMRTGIDGYQTLI
jgi:hypothetical protein